MKKQGSALVLSILVLAFFTVMSLNIFYLGQKKAEAAGDKKTGEQVTNSVDMASSIIYQEAYLAENFVRIGMPYYSDIYDDIKTYGFDEYTSEPNATKSYLDISDGSFNKKYAGIKLNKISEYFDSHWDYTQGDSSKQKLITNETVENGEITSRLWHSGGVPSKIFKLWEGASGTDKEKKLSIGGYRLTEISINGETFTKQEEDNSLEGSKETIEDELDENNIYTMTAIFEKIVTMVGNDDIPEMSFKITATETVKLDTSEGTDLESDVIFYDSNIALAIEKI